MSRNKSQKSDLLKTILTIIESRNLADLNDLMDNNDVVRQIEEELAESDSMIEAISANHYIKGSELDEDLIHKHNRLLDVKLFLEENKHKNPGTIARVIKEIVDRYADKIKQDSASDQKPQTPSDQEGYVINNKGVEDTHVINNVEDEDKQQEPVETDSTLDFRRKDKSKNPLSPQTTIKAQEEDSDPIPFHQLSKIDKDEPQERS